MRVQSSTRFAAMAIMFGALACAGNTAREADTDESAAARDTTADTTQNPPGYRGMERDTSMAPTGQQPSDTFLQNQGAGTPQDTAGYSGAERVDTTGQANQQGQTDTTGYGADTTGTPSAGQDTTSMTGQDTTGMAGHDTTGMAGQDSLPTGDTTGYEPSQQPQDTASSR